MTIEIPDSVFTASPKYTANDLRLDVAVALYERKKFSLARAASFAGLTRLKFQSVLAERGIYLHYSIQDLHTDLQNI